MPPLIADHPSFRLRERRRDARLPAVHPLKLQCAHTGKYLSGRTTNLSDGGALLEIDHPSLLVPGQPVRLGIAWTTRQVLLTAAEMVEAQVVRSLGHGERQTVAICFAQRQQLAAAG